MDARGGSGGTGKMKGVGETQLEMDRRLFRKQIQLVEEQMEDVKIKRESYRQKRRERDNLPIVAIVGYTNAGKSFFFCLSWRFLLPFFLAYGGDSGVHKRRQAQAFSKCVSNVFLVCS